MNIIDQLVEVRAETVFDLEPVFFHGMPIEDVKPMLTLTLVHKSGEVVQVSGHPICVEDSESEDAARTTL